VDKLTHAKDESHSMSLLHDWTVVPMLWRSGYNSAHLNFFKENSRAGFNDGAKASTMLSSTSVWRKSYSTNMCNLNDLCQLICPLWHYFRYTPRMINGWFYKYSYVNTEQFRSVKKEISLFHCIIHTSLQLHHTPS
jgi:hypothetical protein